jgi:predicted metal-binding protein
MAAIGLIRCEKNENRCPMTGCLKSMGNRVQGFSIHDHADLVGIFTCHCPGDDLIDKAKILKSKGVDTIHFCTCTFASKKGGTWVRDGGFCGNVDGLMQQISNAVQITCIKGTAHLPEGYVPQVFA